MGIFYTDDGNMTYGLTGLILIAVGVIVYFLYMILSLTYLALTDAKNPTIESVQNPTDYMNKLATWDCSLTIDDMLDKKRRSVWTLNVFDNLHANEAKNESKTPFLT